MLYPVPMPDLSLAPYRRVVDPDQWERIQQLAAPLRGLRVVHINATPTGGGVAEILRTLIPLSRAVGLDAQWQVLPPDDQFFQVTKRMHNWLQGKSGQLSRRDREVYLAYSARVASEVDAQADVWVVHDPQPLALRSLVPLKGPAIWRCHIDCSTPNGGVCRYLMPWVQDYARVVFTMPTFRLDGLSSDQVELEYPAIDPFAAKNRRMFGHTARSVLAGLGIDPQRPLVTQVSRFDPWKNPWEAVDSYRLSKREVPDLQLAMVGVFSASDDPEGPRVYRSLQRYVQGDPDVHLYMDPAQVGAREINAFQSASTAILQRSSREGFALTVTEAMWKGTPVIGTPVGGIVVQITDGRNGFLAASAEDCAARIVELIENPSRARAVGRAARASVRKRFLMPRLLEDELRLYHELAFPMSKRTDAATPVASVA
jgi:trehalose synthase